MSEEYVTKCPIVPPYSNKVTIFGLLMQNLVVKISRKIYQQKSTRAKNLTFRNSAEDITKLLM